MCERFVGWGGEDSAWFHKARLLGRAAVTDRFDQRLYHLYHPNSGGYDRRPPIARNPSHPVNAALLKEIRALTRPGDYLQRFPPPGSFPCPWDPRLVLALLSGEEGTPSHRKAAAVADALRRLYRMEPMHFAFSDPNQPEGFNLPSADVIVCFGHQTASRFLDRLEEDRRTIVLLVDDAPQPASDTPLPRQVAGIYEKREEEIPFAVIERLSRLLGLRQSNRDSFKEDALHPPANSFVAP